MQKEYIKFYIVGWFTFKLSFFPIFVIIIFCFVVAICDLLHDVEVLNGLC